MIKYVVVLFNSVRLDFVNLAVKLIIKKILKINKFSRTATALVGLFFLILLKQPLIYSACWIFLNFFARLMGTRIWRQINGKGLTKLTFLSILTGTSMLKNPYEIECQPFECLIDEEEKDGHQGVADKIAERLSVAEKNFENNMQYSGVAGMYGMQEENLTFTDERVSEHSEKSVSIVEGLSPGNSPGTGVTNVVSGLLKGIDNDNAIAVAEDELQIKDTFKQGVESSIHCGLGTGTYFNYEDDLNDLP